MSISQQHSYVNRSSIFQLMLLACDASLGYLVLQLFPHQVPAFIGIGLPLLFLFIVTFWLLLNPFVEMDSNSIQFSILPFYVVRLYKNDVIQYHLTKSNLHIEFKDLEQKKIFLFYTSPSTRQAISNFFNPH